MTCAEFDRWLDEGAVAAPEREALEHLRTCARCAAALRAARELDVALADFAAPAPAGFTERVMRRVVDAPRRVVAWAPAAEMAWWVRVAADPAVALALVVGGLVAWRGAALPGVAMSLVESALAKLPGAPPALPGGADWRALIAPLSSPSVVLALSIAVAPGMLWASWRLYAWLERSFTPARGRMRRA